MLKEKKYFYPYPVSKTIFTYTYDSNRNKLTEMRNRYEEYPDQTFSQDTSLYIYSYSPNGDLINILHQNWKNNGWVTSGRDTCDYDSNGNLTSKLGQGYENDSWSNSILQSYIYDTIGNLFLWEWFTWNSATNNWEQIWNEPCDIFIKTTYSGKIWNYPVEKFGNGIIFLSDDDGIKMQFHWIPTITSEINNIAEDTDIVHRHGAAA